MRHRTTAPIFVALSAGLALALWPGGAAAKDGDVRVAGTCTRSTSSELKLSDEDGRIEIEFEVDQNRNGVRWTVLLTRDGRRVARLVRTTRPPSGSFEVRRVIANRPGPDVIRARATTRSGEVCRARATWRG